MSAGSVRILGPIGKTGPIAPVRPDPTRHLAAGDRGAAATSTAAGMLQSSYSGTSVTGETVPYEPFPGSPRPMAFTIAFAPVG